MKKYRLYRLIKIMLPVLLPATMQAQDIHFSQFYESSILRNPSLTGIFASDYKLTAQYKNQWSSISKPYQTALVTGEARIPIKEAGDFLSIGLLGYYDKAGSIEQQNIAVYPAINYNKILSEERNSYLSVGFTAGYIQRSIDATKATFNNQFQNNEYNAANPTGENITKPTFNYFDLGTGVTYSSNAGNGNNINYSFGIAGYHFTQPKNSFFDNGGVKLSMRWNVNASMSQQLNEIFSYQLHANYSLQGTSNEMMVGGLVGWNKKDEGYSTILFALYGGVFYRSNDAFIPVVKVRYKDYNFAFSYDANVSKLHIATNVRGGYELTVIKTGLFGDPNEGKARTICPDH